LRNLPSNEAGKIRQAAGYVQSFLGSNRDLERVKRSPSNLRYELKTEEIKAQKRVYRWRYAQLVGRGISDALQNEIRNIVTECSELGWDGYGAVPVSEHSAMEAILFANNLPPTVSTPEVIPEPNGRIGLEWRTHENTYVVSFRGDQTLLYAGIFADKTRLHGTQILSGGIPILTALILAKYFSRKSA
jgi:hypothetical protein